MKFWKLVLIFVGVLIMVKLLGGGSTMSTIVSDMNANLTELKGREVTEVFKDSDGNRRVLLGKGKDGFYGLKVSKEGHDVYDSVGDDLIFSSENNVFKIIHTDIINVTKPANENVASAVYVHNLGFAPANIAYYIGTSNDGQDVSSQLPFTLFSFADGTLELQINVRTNESLFEVFVSVPNTSLFRAPELTFPIKYYLVQETAN